MIDLNALRLRVVADVSQAKREIESIGETGSKTSTKFNKLNKAMSFLKTAAIVTGVKLATDKIKGLAEKTANYGDTVEKASQRVGMSTETYQKWDYVMKLNGTSMGKMGAGVKTLTKQMTAAQGGTKASVDAFKKLGISQDDLANKSREQIFSDSIKGLQGIKDETERAALANQLFGRSGQALMPILNKTNESTKEAKKRAEELGLVMSEKDVKAAAEFKDAQEELQMANSGLRNNIMSALMPTLAKLTEKTSDTVSKISKFVHSHHKEIASVVSAIASAIKIAVNIIINVVKAVKPIVQPILEFIAKHLKIIIPLIMAVVGAIAAVKGAMKIVSIVQTVIRVINKIKNALMVLNAVMMANPIVFIIAAVAALIAALVILYKHNKKFRAAINALGAHIKSFAVKVKNITVDVVKFIPRKISALIKKIKSFGSSFFGAGKHIITSLWNGIKNVWSAIVNWIPSKIKSFKDKFKNIDLFSAGKHIITSLWNGLKSAWGTLKGWASDVVQWIKDKFTIDISGSKHDKGAKIRAVGHRTGLDEVPYDGYAAVLHKGEMVLTQAEAMRYKDNETQAVPTVQSVSINMSGNYSFRDKADMDYIMDELGRRFKREVALGV